MIRRLAIPLTIAAAGLLAGAEVVSYPSGAVKLHGVIYRPAGKGPFRAVLYNHGSAPDNTSASEALGPLFASRGWLFFMPHRRGQGLSSSAGAYIGKQIAAAREAGGFAAATLTMIQLHKTDHLDDQLAAFRWLKDQQDVLPDRIAVAGNSFGGIQTLLGAESGGYCAAVNFSGASQSWAHAPELQALMIRAARNARAPIFFIQPENDYDLAPARALAPVMREAGRPFTVKTYRAFGNSAEEGHSFAYKGAAIWADDVFRFLDQHCTSTAATSGGGRTRRMPRPASPD